MAHISRPIFYFVSTATVAGLGLVNWYALNSPVDTSPIVAPVSAAATEQSTAAPQAIALTLGDLGETVSRPLFNPTRRQKVKAATVEVASAPPIAVPPPAVASAANASLRLLGIMHGDIDSGGAGKRVLIQALNASEASWVKIGSEISGWRLTNIDSDGVVVEASGTRTVLKLHPSTLTTSTTQ